MSEDATQQHRYCTNCGAEVRSGNVFCISCGAPLGARAQESVPPNAEPASSEGSSPFDKLRFQFRRTFNQVREISTGANADDMWRLPRRMWEWFRDLPSIPKLVLGGLVLLSLLILLSPVVTIIFMLLFGVSIIALIIRMAQKRSVKNWGGVAVASVVLIFTFGGISNALYGGGGGASSEQSGGGEINAKSAGRGGVSSVTPSASPSANPSTPPSASPSPSPDSGEVTFTGEVFGYGETFNYDGLTVTGTVVDWNGNHIMVIQDPMQGGGFMLGYPGDEVTVTGEYRGTITTSEGFSYEAVMAEDVESAD